MNRALKAASLVLAVSCFSVVALGAMGFGGAPPSRERPATTVAFVTSDPFICIPSTPVVVDTPPGSLRGEIRGAQEITIDKEGVSVVVDAGIFAGQKGELKFSKVLVIMGEIADGKAPDPHAGCTTSVSIDGGRATIKCVQQSACQRACGLNSYTDSNGVTAYSCECNLP